jgi:RNA polymerase sigma factor (sigma-70 family)
MYATSAEQRRRAQVESLATEIFSTRYRQLFKIASANAPSPAEAEEALQEAFLAFITHFDPDGKAPALAWLVLTLKRACWDKRRHLYLDRHVCPQTSSEAEEPGSVVEQFAASHSDTQSSIERSEDLADAREQLAALKPDERTALLLFGCGYSYREIAELRGWTYTKVNRCMAEGRAALRERRMAS